MDTFRTSEGFIPHGPTMTAVQPPKKAPPRRLRGLGHPRGGVPLRGGDVPVPERWLGAADHGRHLDERAEFQVRNAFRCSLEVK